MYELDEEEVKATRANLLVRTAVKAYVLYICNKNRSHLGINRVSKEYLDNLEIRLKNIIVGDVHRHRSVGKTFKP